MSVRWEAGPGKGRYCPSFRWKDHLALIVSPPTPFFPKDFICLRERETWGGGEEQTNSLLSVEPDMELDPRTDIMTLAKTKSQTLNQLSHPSVPPEIYFIWAYLCNYHLE